jgi:hypothetical protein
MGRDPMKDLIPKWKIQIETIESAVNAGEIKLNDWEIHFVDTCSCFVNSEKPLSFRQSSCLNKIYGKIK